MKNIQIYTVTTLSNIREAIQRIDQNGEGFVFVVDADKKVKGLITDGDFRRAIINGVSLETKCIDIANKNFTYLNQDHDSKDIINLFLRSILARSSVHNSLTRSPLP